MPEPNSAETPLVQGFRDAFPRPDTSFILTLRAMGDPLDLVATEHEPERWVHTGAGMYGTVTRSFTLKKSAGTVIDVLRLYEGPMLKRPEGQWIKALKSRYPYPEGTLIVCVPDPSWIHPLGGKYFPCAEGCGEEWLSSVVAQETPLGSTALWLFENV